MKNTFFIFLIALSALAGSCSFIAGPSDDEQRQLAPFKIRFVESFRNQASLRGESTREFTGYAPSGLALKRPSSVYADQFRVYVTDTASPAGVLVFDRGERSLTILPPPSSSSNDARLLAPSGVAVDASGVIYVSDAQQGRVLGFDLKGRLLYVLGRTQTAAAQQGIADLVNPAGLAVDHVRNRLYVVDTQAQQVKVFSGMGIHLFDMGNRAKKTEDFKFPVSVAVDRAGRVYVLDSHRYKVFVFDPEGTFLHSFSLKGPVPGQSVRPKGIAVDSDGHVYVIDSVNNNVLIFNPDGGLVLTWGQNGKLNGDFWTPVGIFIDSHDTIYIVDQTNSRVQTFQYVK